MTSPKEIISRCVDEFEMQTQVELVVSIIKKCDSYNSFFWFYTLLFVQTFWISTLLWNEFFEFAFLVAESMVIIGLNYIVLLKFDILKYLVPKKIKKEKLKKMADQTFYKLGLFSTKRRSGLLVIYSHFENECYLIADKGITEKVSKADIDKMELDFQMAFKSKNLAESVGSLIRTYGVFWKDKWPNEDDENEISVSFSDGSI